MKKLLVILIASLFLMSCGPGRWKIGQSDKLHNIASWKANKEARKAERHSLAKQ